MVSSSSARPLVQTTINTFCSTFFPFCTPTSTSSVALADGKSLIEKQALASHSTSGCFSCLYFHLLSAEPTTFHPETAQSQAPPLLARQSFFSSPVRASPVPQHTHLRFQAFNKSSIVINDAILCSSAASSPCFHDSRARGIRCRGGWTKSDREVAFKS